MRHSKSYGCFIPIGYPNALQRGKGFTGGEVGIHGPDRRLQWLGGAVNWFDTTDGCVGVATDSDVLKIGWWIRASSAKFIVLDDSHELERNENK